jgi:hypothetical protein
MGVDAKLANEFLKNKYAEKTELGYNLTNEVTPLNKPFLGIGGVGQVAKSSELSWKVLAEERAAALLEKQQLLIQFRDEMQAWYEAYKSEKERADKFENLFLESCTTAVELNETEIKHTVSSPAQVNRKRANWPSVRKLYESAHDAGVGLQPKEIK